MSELPVELTGTVAHLKSKAWAISTGLLLGIGLFVATNLLVLKGGEHVGAHLSMLGILLPGYRVTFAGSLIGFAYMFVIGYALGRVVGGVYERLLHS